jgi:hypothetical protein
VNPNLTVIFDEAQFSKTSGCSYPKRAKHSPIRGVAHATSSITALATSAPKAGTANLTVDQVENAKDVSSPMADGKHFFKHPASVSFVARGIAYPDRGSVPAH